MSSCPALPDTSSALGSVIDTLASRCSTCPATPTTRSRHEACSILPKPFSAAALSAAVRAVLDAP
jgi:hypothetical protein